MAAAAPEAEEPETEPNLWEELLRKMLPEGAPLPDEDQLDYSISVDYVGLSPFFKPPDVNPMIPKYRFTTFPKRAPSLTPKNPSWIKSRSSSETTSSDNRRLSASSIAFDDDNASDGGIEHDPQHDQHDPDNYNEEKIEVERRDCDLSVSNNTNRGKWCSRCGKGRNGLLRRRERCIVCGAEYCKKWVSSDRWFPPGAGMCQRPLVGSSDRWGSRISEIRCPSLGFDHV